MTSKSLNSSAGSSKTRSKSLGQDDDNGVTVTSGPLTGNFSFGTTTNQGVTIDANGSAAVTGSGTTSAIDPSADVVRIDNGIAQASITESQTTTSGLPFELGNTPGGISLLDLPTTTADPIAQSTPPSVTPTSTSVNGTVVGQSADGQTFFVQSTPGGPIVAVPLSAVSGATTGDTTTDNTTTVGTTTDDMTFGEPATPTMTTTDGQLSFPISLGMVTVADGITMGTVGNAASEFGPFAAYEPGDAELTTSFTGTPTSNSIDGTRGDDLIEGAGGNDRLEGRFGNDFIVGGSGSDRVRGDEGDDRIYGGADGDKLSGNEGDDLIFGEAGDDFINGDRDDDILDGGSGDDVIIGEGGDDAVLGGAGDDTLTGDQGDDLLAGGPGDDLLDGGVGDDVLHGGDGDDVIETGAGMNIADGSDGMDDINAVAGNNILFGGRDDDMITAQSGTALLFGGEGNDTLSGNEANVILAGGLDDDIMDAGQGDGVHIGGFGSDTFVIGANVIGNGQADRVFALDFAVGEDTLDIAPTVLDSITSIENTSVDVMPLIQMFNDAGLNDEQSFDRMSLVDSSSDFQDDLMFLLDIAADHTGKLMGNGLQLTNAEGDQFFLLNVEAEDLGLETTDDTTALV